MKTFKGFSEKIKEILEEKYEDENVKISLKKDTGLLRIKDKDNDVKEDYNLNEMYEEYMANREENADLGEGNRPYKPKHFAKSIKEDFDSKVNTAKLDNADSFKDNKNVIVISDDRDRFYAVVAYDKDKEHIYYQLFDYDTKTPSMPVEKEENKLIIVGPLSGPVYGSLTEFIDKVLVPAYDMDGYVEISNPETIFDVYDMNLADKYELQENLDAEYDEDLER